MLSHSLARPAMDAVQPTCRRGGTVDLSALLGRIMLDPVSFAERVLQPVQDQLVSKGAFEATTDTSPDELIATALGTWIANRLTGGGSPIDEAGANVDESESPSDEDLVDRDRVLAAALGACPCWGQDVDCAVCRGAGTPGWRTPDRQLYAEYVQPAVTATARNSDTAIPPQWNLNPPEWNLNIKRKENGHV
jgi:hypothetical protein